MKNNKKIWGIAAFTMIGMALTTATFAQQNESIIQKAGHGIKKGANAVGKTATKVGHKTAEVGVKGESAVVDNVYKDKVAPDGSTVYIGKHDKKYYVNKKGKKVYLKASQIKDKPKED